MGKIILEGLVASSRFEITVISRKASEATFPPGVTVLKIDYSDKDLEAAFKGKDVVISAVGAQALGDQKKFVDAAIRADVKRFIGQGVTGFVNGIGAHQAIIVIKAMTKSFCNGVQYFHGLFRHFWSNAVSFYYRYPLFHTSVIGLTIQILQYLL